jgi:subtilisin family serine protease
MNRKFDMKKLFIALAAIALPLVLGTGSAFAADKALIKGEAIVIPAPGVRIEEILADYRATIADQFQQANGTTVYLLRLRSRNKTNRQVRRLQADVRVASASTNTLLKSPVGRHNPISFPFDTPTLASPDPFDSSGYDNQTFLTNLRLAQALTVSRGTNVVVAIIDTGVDVSGHPELSARLWANPREQANGVDDDNADGFNLVDDLKGWDFFDGDNDPTEAGSTDDDGYGHGTFIAGIIAKIAPEARIMPVRVFGPNGEGTAWNVARAIEYAVAHGAMVVNMSFGSDEDLDPIHDIVGDVKDRAVLVGAAGNAGGRTEFPARRSEVIAVAAVTDQDQKATFTNFGSDIDVSAPGVGIKSMFPGGRYATWSGTSFATPVVSATAALRIARVLNASPSIRLDDLVKDTVDAIEDNTSPVSGDGLGRGRIDILKVLAARLPDGDDDSDGSDDSDDRVVGFAFAVSDGSLQSTIDPVFDIVRVEIRDEQQRTVLSRTFGAGTAGLR